jgi:hypothetical protein
MNTREKLNTKNSNDATPGRKATLRQAITDLYPVNSKTQVNLSHLDESEQRTNQKIFTLSADVAEKSPIKTKPVIAKNALAVSFLGLRAQMQVGERYFEAEIISAQFQLILC